jgi:hypothetical protein
MSLRGFVEKSDISIYDSHEKGDPCKFKKRPPKNDYGFKCSVSDQGFDDFEGQISDAITFLSNHIDELKKLVSQYDIYDIRLDFPIESRLMKQNLFSQCDFLPPELIKLSGEVGLGIEISQYCSSDE